MEGFFQINQKYSRYIHEHSGDFGKRLSQLIGSKGLSVEEFESLNHYRGLRDIMQGYIIPCDSTINTLATNLGVSESFLVYGS